MKDASPRLDVKEPSVSAYWIIGVFIFVNTMICYFDRVNFSVAAPAIMKHFDMYLTAPKATREPAPALSQP